MLKCTIEIKDLKTNRSKFQEMHSFVSNFLGLLSYGFGFTPEFAVRSRDNSNIGAAYLKQVTAGSNDLTNGLLVGLGNTSLQLQDHDLDIPSSLDCGPVTVSIPTDVENLRVITVSRSFVNNTASDIVIKELGLFCESSNADNPYLITRDVLETPETFHPDDAKLFKLHIGFAVNFTNWFLYFMQYKFLDISGGVKNTEGTYQTTNFWEHRLNALEGNKAWGIVIGSGTSAPTTNDYCMENRLSSSWDYSDVYLNHCVQDDTNHRTKLGLYRRFTNNTGITQHISEIGIIAYFGEASYQKCMFAHYVIDPLELVNGQTAIVYWNFWAPIATYDPPYIPED